MLGLVVWLGLTLGGCIMSFTDPDRSRSLPWAAFGIACASMFHHYLRNRAEPPR